MSLKQKINDLVEAYHYGPIGGQEVFENDRRTFTNKYHYAKEILWLISQNEIKGAIKKFDYLYDNCSEEIWEKQHFEWISKEIERFDLTWFNKVNKIKKSQKYGQITSKRQFFDNQLKSFDGFRYSQNKFDNMISIMKIYRRYNDRYNKKEKMNLEFENKDDIFDNIKEKIIQEINKEFEELRYEL